MSLPAIQSIPEGTLIPGWAFDVETTEQGTLFGTHTVICRKETVTSPLLQSLLSKGTKATDLDPNLPAIYSRLRLLRHRIRHLQGGLAEILLDFGGQQSTSSGDPNDSASFAKYDYFAETRDMPLTEHWKFKALSGADKYIVGEVWDEPQVFTWDSTDGLIMRDPWVSQQDWISLAQPTASDAEEMIQKILQGDRTFLGKTLIYRKRWADVDRVPDAILSAVGTVASALDGSDPDGDVPTLDGSADWLVGNARSSGREGAWNNEIEWWASHGDQPWDDFKYEID